MRKATRKATALPGVPALGLLLSTGCSADRPTRVSAHSSLDSVAAATGLRVSTIEELARGAELTLAKDTAANGVRVRAFFDFIKDEQLPSKLVRDATGRCGASQRAALISTLERFADMPEVRPILHVWGNAIPAATSCPGETCCLTSGGECLGRLQGGGCSSSSCATGC